MKRKDSQEMTRLEKIEYYANSTNMISVNNGNRKTGTACLTLSFPTCSCRDDAPCKKGCYCMKGPQQFPNVQGAYFRNWRLWNEDPEKFERQLNSIIEFSGLTLFRYCDCGDLPNQNFIKTMARVARNNPSVGFLAYTKKYDMVNTALRELRMPDNLIIRFSYWDTNWGVDNPHQLPVAFVNFKESSRTPIIPKNAYECKGGKDYTCSVCKMCWNKQVQSIKFNQH